MGKIKTPAGADHGPIIMIFAARILAISIHEANRMPARKKTTETFCFIFLFFTWLSSTRLFRPHLKKTSVFFK